MKLLYATTACLPTTLAHGLQIVENCSAFAAAGTGVTLLRARRRPAPGIATGVDPRDYYGVARDFAIESLPCLEPTWSSRLLQSTAFRLMAASFGVGLLARVRRLGPDGVLYSRDPVPLLFASFALPPRRLAYEAHQLPRSRQGRWLHRACVRRAGLVVAVTERIAAAASAAGARATLVARDGFRAARYAGLPTRGAARHSLGLPPDGFIVGYVGQLRTLGMAKGVEQLVDALGRFRDAPCSLAIVGGSAAEVEALRRRWQELGLASDRLIAPGQVPPEQVPLWLAALDVGTIPFPNSPHYAECASPMKLFEYLAAGLPIVASDLPALAEVLVDGETALLTPPGDVAALAAALRRLREDAALRATLASGALRAAGAYTWTARAQRVIGALQALQA